MTKRPKVAISISAEALAAAERRRTRTGERRSAVFERALLHVVADARRARRSRRYVKGYRRRPERRTQAATALGTALTALAAEPWDEAR